MISKTMTDAMNKQINEELYSAYLYFSMSSCCSMAGLKGGANWFFVQGQEEMTHAWRFFLYVNSQNQQAILDAIQKPPSAFKSLQHMYEEALKHEHHITACINKLVNLARKESDHASENFLQWFVKEQIEEEQNDTDVLARLKLAGKDGSAMLMIDSELATRVFVPAPDLPGGSATGGGGTPAA